jgi:hypothetical protein
MRSSLFVVFLAGILCGCANVEYTAYSGGQQNWPVASGSFVQRKFDLPVYFGSPDRRYRILGYMEVESAPLAVWETGKSESIKPAVREAIKHGADALVLLASGTNISGSHSVQQQVKRGDSARLPNDRLSAPLSAHSFATTYLHYNVLGHGVPAGSSAE